MSSRTMKLYAPLENMRAVKIRVAAELCGVPLESVPMVLGTDNKAPEYLAKNPNGKVPTLETESGILFESNAILRYVARQCPESKLYGNNFLESASIDRWIDWYMSTLEPVVTVLYKMAAGHKPMIPAVFEKARRDAAASLRELDAFLLDKTFLGVHTLSIADLTIATGVFRQFSQLFDPNYRAAFPNVTRWFLTVTHQPAFLAHQSPKPLCSEVFVASVEEKNAPQTQEKAPKPPPKASKAAPTEVEKAEKASQAAEEAEEGEGEGGAAKKAEAKNPLESLPPSPMVLDDWKRTYSNYHEADRRGVMPQFYSQLDPVGYSLWTCEYNYDIENTVGFMTCNLVEGFIQRTDPLRKYAFGTMLVLKKPECTNFFVKGAWLIRGQTIEPMLETNPDAEYFTWKKVSLEDEAHKALLADLWCCDDEFREYAVESAVQFK